METAPVGTADAIENADIEVGRALAKHRNHPVVDWCCGVGEVGDQGPLYLIGSSLVAAGFFRKSPRCLLAGISMIAAVGVADFSKSTVKRLVKRSRPDHSLEKGDYRFETGGSPIKKEQSFPSGHVACTVAASETVSRFYPVAAPYVRSVAAVIGLSRIAKGDHWPLDIVVGSIIGFSSNRLTRKLLPLLALPFLRQFKKWKRS